MLTIALPKGRIAEDTLAIFSKIFNTSFEFDDRKLIFEKNGFRFLKVRNQDVPVYVSNLAADIGVVGLDVLEENEYDVLKLLDLGIGKCRVCVGSHNDYVIDYNKPDIKVATKMPNIAKKFFAQKAMAVEMIKLYGSIELAPLVGLSDVIVDIVETGSTMKQNNLKVDEVIMESSVYLISNKNSFYQNKKSILSLLEEFKKYI